VDEQQAMPESEFAGPAVTFPDVVVTGLVAPPPRSLPPQDFAAQPPPRTDVPLLGPLAAPPPMTPPVTWGQPPSPGVPPVPWGQPPSPSLPQPVFNPPPLPALPQPSFAPPAVPPLPQPTYGRAETPVLPQVAYGQAETPALPPAEAGGYRAVDYLGGMGRVAEESVAPKRDWRHGEPSSNAGLSGVRTHSSLMAWPDAESGPKTIGALRAGWAFSYQGVANHGMQRRKRQEQTQKENAERIQQRQMAKRPDFIKAAQTESSKPSVNASLNAHNAGRTTPAVPRHTPPHYTPPVPSPHRPLPEIPLAPGAPAGPGAHHAAGVTPQGLAAAAARHAGYQHSPRPAYVPPPPPVPTPVRRTP
jgi:hypothetical protein